MHTIKLYPSKQFSLRLYHRLTSVRPEWGLWAASTVGLLAIWLTVAHGLPFGHDSARHVYRLVDRDYLIQHGLFFTRWSPFLGSGYGAPLYNYYQPLLDYLAEPFMLIGWGPLVALRIILGFALMAGALGMYRWVSDLFGGGAGVVAAMAYLFSPYVMYTLLNRAGFAELLGLGLAPWGLWALRRYASDHKLSDGVATTVIVAAMLLAHIFTAFLFLATLLLYIPILAVAYPFDQHQLRNVIALCWPIGLGLGVAAFFWLPLIWEIELNTPGVLPAWVVVNPPLRQSFIPLWQVFTGPVLPDPFAPVATIPPRLSWFAASLAAVGVVTGITALRSPVLKLHLWVGALATAIMVFMFTSTARWLWQIIPLLGLQPYPFRLLGLASLWQALLAGAGAAALLALLNKPSAWHLRIAPVLVAALCLVLGLYALNWPSVAYLPPNLSTTLAAAVQYQLASDILMLGDELPLTGAQQHSALLPVLEIGEARLDQNSLPGGARQIAAQYDLLYYKLTIASPQPFQLVIKTFYFPGWWATVNGKRVPITPTDPDQLITLPVPAGQHTIEIGFGSTPVRTVADGISLLSVICLAGLFIKTRQHSVVEHLLA